jgi:hypothetical protein
MLMSIAITAPSRRFTLVTSRSTPGGPVPVDHLAGECLERLTGLVPDRCEFTLRVGGPEQSLGLSPILVRMRK